MKFKKLLALGMASMMVLSTTTMAFAADAESAPAEGTAGAGTGTIEGYVNKDVFTVTLPTTAALDFTIDPQELLLAVTPALKVDLGAGAGAAQAVAGYGANVLFKTAADEYSVKSPDMTVINKSTFDIGVKINAKVTGLADETAGYDIKLVDTSADDFDWGKDTALELKLTPSTNTAEYSASKNAELGTNPSAGTGKVLTADAAGVSMYTKVEKAADVDKAYAVSGTTGAYTYGIKANTAMGSDTVNFNAVTYNLAGQVNVAADWSKFNAAATTNLAVDVTYVVDKYVAPPAVAAITGGFEFTGLTADANVDAVNIKVKSATKEEHALNSAAVEWDTDEWTAEAGGTISFTFKDEYVTHFNGEEITMTATLSDGTVLTETVTVAVTP